MQSNGSARLHIGIIMDGNGRWAAARGLPRTRGHEAGVKAIHRTLEAARDLDIGTLTLYAFSIDNWKRPGPEVAALMGLLRRYIEAELERLVESGVRLTVIGRRDRLPAGLADRIAHAEGRTAGGCRMHLRIAVDYSSRDAILAAARRLAEAGEISRNAFSRLIAGDTDTPDVDLLIRTSGEQRLSDFLLWESAYAELHFTGTLWPDFGERDLRAAVEAFSRRNRRFGGLPAARAEENEVAGLEKAHVA